MRILNGLLAAVLALLAFVNFNDPEAMALVPALAAAALWTGLAAIVPAAMAMRPLVVLLSFAAAAILLGVWYHWPGAEGIASPAVWAGGRFGGFLFAALTLVGPMLTSIRQEKLRRQKRLADKEARITERHRGSLARGA